MNKFKMNVAATLAAAVLLANGAGAATAAQQDDAALAANIHQVIGAHPGLRVALRVQVKEGVTYVYGTFDTSLEEADAIELIQHIPGVGKVVDMTSVSNT